MHYAPALLYWRYLNRNRKNNQLRPVNISRVPVINVIYVRCKVTPPHPNLPPLSKKGDKTRVQRVALFIDHTDIAQHFIIINRHRRKWHVCVCVCVRGSYTHILLLRYLAYTYPHRTAMYV